MRKILPLGMLIAAAGVVSTGEQVQVDSVDIAPQNQAVMPTPSVIPDPSRSVKFKR